jgi:integrase
LLPPHARIPVTIEYWLGTRQAETMSLEWPHVYFNHQSRTVEIRLASESTKTDEERVAVMGGDLYEVLAAWYKQTLQFHPDCRWVCHLDGRKLASIKTSWRTACVAAGLGRFDNPKGRFVGNRRYRGALIHDFRRIAVSNMEDAGVPRKVAMAISGHKTDSVYRRYHIVKRSDLVEAGRRLLDHHEREHGRGEQLVNSAGSDRSAGKTKVL